MTGFWLQWWDDTQNVLKEIPQYVLANWPEEAADPSYVHATDLNMCFLVPVMTPG